MSPGSKLAIALACLGSAPLAAARPWIDWTEPSVGVSIAADPDNNAYTVNSTMAPGGDLTLTKHAPDGQILWTVSHDQTDNTKWEAATWVATDHAGDVIVTGSLMSGFSNPVNAASIVMKFDANGALLWRSVFESSFDGSSTRKCVIDDLNNIYVLGLGVGPNGLVTRVKKFAPDGSALWSYFDSDGIGAPVNLKLTPDNQLLITGRGITGAINGYARITLDGNEVWSLAGVPSFTVGDAAGDEAGNTYIVHHSAAGNGPSVLKKLDPLGQPIWETTHPFAGSRVEATPEGDAIVAGFPNTGTAGAAFIKVSQDGDLLWEQLDADGPLLLLLHAYLLIDAQGDAYLAAGTLFDMAVCRVSADGSSTWVQTTPGGYARGMALSADQHSMFLVGGNTVRIGIRCPGDANLDDAIDVNDLNTVLASWGTGGPAGDLNHSGTVDVNDLNLVLANWNNNCN